MTQEEKQLLLKVLCEGLPYRVRARFCDGVKEEIDDIWDIDIFSGAINADYIIDDVKPYLRSLLSMTEEEVLEFSKIEGIDVIAGTEKVTSATLSVDAIDWLNEHHFDYRGLIEKGLALETPESMYKNE